MKITKYHLIAEEFIVNPILKPGNFNAFYVEREIYGTFDIKDILIPLKEYNDRIVVSKNKSIELVEFYNKHQESPSTPYKFFSNQIIYALSKMGYKNINKYQILTLKLFKNTKIPTNVKNIKIEFSKNKEKLFLNFNNTDESMQKEILKISKKYRELSKGDVFRFIKTKNPSLRYPFND